MRWTVLIPAKATSEAKTRLIGTHANAAAHAALVEAIRADTVHAAAACSEVARVVLVVDHPGVTVHAAAPVEVVVQSVPGLNGALAEAAEHAAHHWPADGVVALLGDVPALRPDELGATLRAAAEHPRGFVADSTGLGTTLLTALPGVALAPQFGAGSAARHERDAVALPATAGVRRDVDTAADLADALAIGVGPATAAAVLLADDAVDAREIRAVHLDSA